MTRFATVVIGIGLVASACDGPTRPSPSPAAAPTASPTSPAVPSSLQALVGSYDLKVTLPDQCTELAEAARRRTYRATLEATSSGYLGIQVTGGGYSAPTGVGVIRPAGSADFVIDWSNYDYGDCGGSPEQLADGSWLMFCGVGPGVLQEGGRISVALRGRVMTSDAAGQWRTDCAGVHQLTFTKQ